MSTIDDIMTRTSVRVYDDKDVSDTIVRILLKAAMAAPTAVNKQPWAFVVVRDSATIHKLGANPRPNGQKSPIYDAKLVIAVCGDMSLTLEGDWRPFWVQDTSAASENLLLAAHALGLGAVWTGVYPIQERVQMVRETLNLPSNFDVNDLSKFAYIGIKNIII